MSRKVYKWYYFDSVGNFTTDRKLADTCKIVYKCTATTSRDAKDKFNEWREKNLE